MSTYVSTSRPHGRTQRAQFLIRMTEEQHEELLRTAEDEGVTVRALVLHRTLGIALDDPSLSPKPGRKTPPQEALPMSA